MSTYPAPTPIHEVEHHAHTATSTGLGNKKVGMWLFLASECMLFGALIGTYLIYAGRSVVGPYPQDLFDIPLTTISTTILLASSLFIALAVSAAQEQNQPRLRIWLLGTIVMGLAFLGIQIYEWVHFVQAGLYLRTNLFGTTFYFLTGIHKVHLTVGLIWLGALLISSLRGNTQAASHENVEVAGLYWHFVDLAWIVIFAVVFLMA